MDKCSQCGVCCKLFLINLDEAEYRSKKYRTIFEEFGFEEDFAEAEFSCANILAKNDDDSCIYLKENKCSIHEQRPLSCRKFFCNSEDKQFQGMIEKIKEHKLNSVK